MATEITVDVYKFNGVAYNTPVSRGFPTENTSYSELTESVTINGVSMNSAIYYDDNVALVAETTAELDALANSGGGGIESIVAGDGIGVDDTDPANPVVSATGGGGVTSVTYAQLSTLIGSSGLTAGQQYLISDFATVHYIVDTSGDQYLSDIITGVNEPLIVTATSVNTIDKNAKSASYPEDVIYYDWNPDNWLDDLSFADLSGTPAIITGFKGVIYFRHDTLLDNYCGYDFRNVKFRRWQTNAAAWDSGTTYSAGDFVTSSSVIYVSLVGSNTNNTPASSAAFWSALVDLSLSSYCCSNPTSSNGILSNSGVYDDFKTFAEASGTATYNICCRSTHLPSFRDTQSYFDIAGTILSNNVFFLGDYGYYQVYSNEFSPETFGNTFLGFCNNNNVGTFFIKNILGDSFTNNLVANDFLGNTANNNFSNNVIGNNFTNNRLGASFSYNSVSNNFSENKAGANFRYNTIGSYFVTNYIKNSFQYNNTQDKLNGSSIDLTSATHVYAAYSCSLFIREDGGQRLSYFDGSDTLTVVAATA